MWTLVVECCIAVSLFAEWIVDNACCQRTIIMVSALSFIMLNCSCIGHLEMTISGGVTLLRRNIIHVSALCYSANMIMKVKGWGNNTWNKHFLVVLVCLFDVKRLIFLVCTWIEIVNWVWYCYSSLFHYLFLKIFILLWFQNQLFLKKPLSNYWCKECFVARETPFLYFSINALCFYPWLSSNCSHSNLPPNFILLFSQFLNVFLSLLL